MRVVDRNGPPPAESPVAEERDGGECMYEGGPSASGVAVTVREREREGPGAVRRERCGEGLAALPAVVVAPLSFSVRAKSKLSLRWSFVRLFCILKIEIVEASVKSIELDLQCPTHFERMNGICN